MEDYKTKRFTRLTHTGSVVELEHLKKNPLDFFYVFYVYYESRKREPKKVSKFICSRLKKRRKPRVKLVTLKLC
jgi:hypothetical protein